MGFKVKKANWICFVDVYVFFHETNLLILDIFIVIWLYPRVNENDQLCELSGNLLNSELDHHDIENRLSHIWFQPIIWTSSITLIAWSSLKALMKTVKSMAFSACSADQHVKTMPTQCQCQFLSWIVFRYNLPSKMWDEITYPFPNFNCFTHYLLYNGCYYLCMMGLKFIHVSKRGPWSAKCFRYYIQSV